MAEKANLYGSLKKNVCRFLVNYLMRFGVAGVVVFSCWIAIVNYNYWFSWHVILCTFGYLPIMAESMMLFFGDEIWSRQLSRQALYGIHGVLISLGMVMIIAGNSVVFHYFDPGYHFNTAHGVTGLVSMIILILSIPFGLAIKYSAQTKRLIKIPGVWVKFLHNFLGFVGYAIGIASLCLAYYTNWFKYYTSEQARLAALIVTIVGSLWSVSGALASGYNQIKSIVGF